MHFRKGSCLENQISSQAPPKQNTFEETDRLPKHAEKVKEVSGVREFCQHPTKSQQKTGNLGLFGALLQPPAPGKITKLGKDPIKI